MGGNGNAGMGGDHPVMPQQDVRAKQDVRSNSSSNFVGGRVNDSQSSNMRGSNATVGRRNSSQEDIQQDRSNAALQKKQAEAMKDVKNALKDIGKSGASSAPKNKEGRYGILGLLDIIRMTDKNMNLLALGQDLTTMGLNMNSSENLYSQFSSPWSDEPSSKTPPYTTPSCYMIPPPALKAGHLKKFNIQSLFYVFYVMPRDILSMYVTKELYRRNWMYHKKTKLWFTNEGSQEGLQFFDTKAWELAPYKGNAHDLTADFLSLAEVSMDQQQQQQPSNGQNGNKSAPGGGGNTSS